jgi:hypothetical protein
MMLKNFVSAAPMEDENHISRRAVGRGMGKRSVQVLRHHVVAAETRYETVGQVYFGLPPDFPALAF